MDWIWVAQLEGMADGYKQDVSTTWLAKIMFAWHGDTWTTTSDSVNRPDGLRGPTHQITNEHNVHITHTQASTVICSCGIRCLLIATATVGLSQPALCGMSDRDGHCRARHVG